MPSLRERFQRWPRPWRLAVVVVLALYVLYLLAGNIYLNTPLFDASTNRQPHKFTLQTGPALTLFPGEVMAWNVRMRGQANRTVYVFHADRAHARIALLALFRREVRLPWLHATNVSAEVETSDTLSRRHRAATAAGRCASMRSPATASAVPAWASC